MSIEPHRTSSDPAVGCEGSFRLRTLIITALLALLLALCPLNLAAAQSPEGQQPSGQTALDEVTFAGELTRIRKHISDVFAAALDLPAQFGRAASILIAELRASGSAGPILLLALFAAAGLAAQWLFWRATSRFRNWIEQIPLMTFRQRLLGLAARFGFGLGSVIAFAAGSIGMFLVFEWPPLLKEIVFGYLLAILAYKLVRVVLEFFLSPPEAHAFSDPQKARLITLSDESASFWTRRLSFAVGWLTFGWVTVGLMSLFDFPRPSQQVVAYLLGLVLLGVCIESVWRRPQADEQSLSTPQRPRMVTSVKARLFSLYFVALWLLWAAGMMRLFWLAVVIAGLPSAVRISRMAVDNILRPAGMGEDGGHAPSVVAAVIERGVRFLLLVFAVILLAYTWGVDLTELTTREHWASRLLQGAFKAAVAVLIADFVWHVVKTLIDVKLAEAADPGMPGTELARRRSRIRTLLPILRNVLMIVVAVVAVLMVLSSMGIDIAPLIAGAGVVGVAVGFGAQTIVKDIISGMFYLLDDAFRVGEYIQSGSYKGTVESFSLRSIRLRHHRGAVFIVPFSELGAVQNMSRDWVIEKITVNVTYDSDVELARKLVKKIGLELAQDPEFAASTLEPLKMQGIAEFGDSALVLSMKLKTRPGEQFGIKRRALKMIREAFEKNGIKLAFPTIQVAGGSDAEVAAAAHRINEQRKAASLAVE